MSEDTPSTGEIPADDIPADESIGDSVSRLIASGKDYAQAEIDRQKARAALVGGGVRDGAILFGAAVILLLSALIALLVGLIITLTPHLTAGGATAAVVGGTVLIALILMLLGSARIKKMSKALRE